MSNAAASIESKVRRLRPADLERVIAIDSDHVGEPRRTFFEKRLAQARERPQDYVQVGVARDGELVGFAFARIQCGEFGREQTVATLDAVGVMVGSRDAGVGHALMGGLTRTLCQQGIRSLQSQADWTNHDLLRFFDASGFRLAPRLVLERSALTPLAELVEGD